MLFPGEWVEVLSAGEILATLDANQMLEDLPFMPEMLGSCGRVFQVQIRADRTCVRALPPGETESIRGLQGCVVLAGLRCDGRSHGGCQLGCMFFWKEGWLKKATGPRSGPELPIEPPEAVLQDRLWREEKSPFSPDNGRSLINKLPPCRRAGTEEP